MKYIERERRTRKDREMTNENTLEYKRGEEAGSHPLPALNLGH